MEAVNTFTEPEEDTLELKIQNHIFIIKDAEHAARILKGEEDPPLGMITPLSYNLLIDYLVGLTNKYKDESEDYKIQAQEALNNARTDHLTALYNQTYFKERLEIEVERAHRYQASLSLVMMDLDHFKKINDFYGHPQGDIVIKDVAERIRYQLRSSDISCRYGGDEFALLLVQTKVDDAQALCKRIEQSFKDTDFSLGLNLTASFGIAQLSSTQTAEEFLQEADSLLYKAKARGRNTIFY